MSGSRGLKRHRASPAPRAGTRSGWRVPAGAVLAGLATGALLGGWTGLVVGVALAGALWRVAARWEPGTARQERQAAAADLPIAVDLLAAALRAGAPPARAAEHPEEAWSALAGIPEADRLRRAAVRSADSGAAMTGALGRLADDLRAARAARVEAGAQRLGVLVVLPLGVCFLPAFVLTGVVPVVATVLGDVLRSR